MSLTITSDILKCFRELNLYPRQHLKLELYLSLAYGTSVLVRWLLSVLSPSVGVAKLELKCQ